MQTNMRSLAKNSGILVVANSSIKLLSFLLMPLYTRALSPADYGVTDMVLNMALLLVAGFSLCIDWGMTAFFYDKKTVEYQVSITTGGMVFCIITSLACLACGGLCYPISLLLFKSGEYWFAVLMGFVYAAVKLLYFAFRVSTRMRGHLKDVAIYSFAELVTLLVFNILLILVFRIGFMSILYANVASQLVCGALYTFGNREFIHKKNYDPALLKTVLKYCAPLTPTVLLTWFNSFADRYFIGMFHDETAVGLYGRAFQLVTLLSVLTTAFLSAYPSFAYSNASDDEKRPQYSMIYDAIVAILAILAFFLTLFGKEIILIMTAKEYHSAYIAIGFLAFGHVFYTLGNVMGYGITIQKNGKLYLLVNGMGAIANIVLNFLLVPYFGFVGAAFTTCMAQLLSMVVSRFCAEKVFRCNYRWIRSLILLFILISVGYLSGEWVWYYKIPILFAAVATVLLLYRSRIPQMKMLLKRKS